MMKSCIIITIPKKVVTIIVITLRSSIVFLYSSVLSPRMELQEVDNSLKKNTNILQRKFGKKKSTGNDGYANH